MSKAIRGTKKKRGRGRPRTTGAGLSINVRCQKPLLAEIDRWRKQQDSELSRPDALRQLAELGLNVAEQSLAGARAPQNNTAASKASELAGRELDRLGDQSLPAKELERRKRRLTKGPPEFREMRDDIPKPKG